MDQRVLAIIASWPANFVNYEVINKNFFFPGKVLHQATSVQLLLGIGLGLNLINFLYILSSYLPHTDHN